MKAFIQKYTRAIVIIDCIVLYFAVLFIISLVRAPAQYEPMLGASTVVSYEDFAVTTGESSAYVSSNALVFKEGEAADKVFSTILDLQELECIAVEFTVNCPEQFTGSVLYVDLCADGYDSPEQEFTVSLTTGENKVAGIIDKGEHAPAQAQFRIFTLGAANYEVTDLAVFPGVEKSNSVAISSALVLIAIGTVLLVAVAAVCKTLHYIAPRNLWCLACGIAKKVHGKTVRTVVFTLIIFLPILLFAGSFLSGKDMDVKLKGNFVNTPYPEFSWDAVASGEYQQGVEAWWNENYGLRGVIIKTYNQISYSVFREGNRIVGKDGYIFEDEYIYSELGASPKYNCSLESNQAAVEQYVETIASVSDKLEKFGKKLIVYTSANKATFCKDSIPWRQLASTENDRGISPIMYFRELVAEKQFTCIDSYDLLKGQEEWPVFYKTGIHWSRPAEQIVTQALMEEIQNSTGLAVPEMQLGKLNVSSEPYWRDSDVYDLLNVWGGNTDQAYYEYSVSTVEPTGAYRPVNVLLQGGSFADGFRSDFLEYSLGGNINYINYCTYIRSNDGQEQGIGNFSDVNMQEMLDTADVVIVEVNESKIMQRSDGFFDYLNAFLDSYLPYGGTTKNVDVAASDTVDTSALRGFYSFEESHVWAQKNSGVTLKDPAISERGLELHVTIPSEVVDTEDGEWRVFVNGQLKCSKSLAESGEFKVVIDVQDVPVTDDTYVIDFRSDGSFIPAEISASGDGRDLSFAVHYIGAKR